MNTINNINTDNMNTVNAATDIKQTEATENTSWMTKAAGFLFWTTVVFQILMIDNNMIDYAFADHIIYNILPLTAALAYFGLKKDLAAIAERKAECQQNTDSNC